MVYNVVKVISSELSLPLLVLQENHVDLGLLGLREEAILLLAVLAEVHFCRDAALVEFVAIDAAFDFREDLCPDHERTQLRQLIHFRPESRAERIVIHFKAKILTSQVVDTMRLSTLFYSYKVGHTVVPTIILDWLLLSFIIFCHCLLFNYSV